VLDNRFVPPRENLAGRMLAAVANSAWLAAVRRATFDRLPFVRIESDVSRVVYLNWVVPLDAVAALVPEGVELDSRNGKTVLTVLTYAHGNFGPAFLGPLRKWFPSPLQSNWRFYVSAINGSSPAHPTVLFARNVFDGMLHAVSTRILSDAMLSHAAAAFEHRDAGDTVSTRIVAGAGSAPELASVTAPTSARQLPDEFAPFFSSWDEAIATLCLQDSAISPVSAISRVAQAGIDLPIRLESVVAMTSVSYEPGELLRSLGALSVPFCFCVPRVRFQVLWERLL